MIVRKRKTATSRVSIPDSSFADPVAEEAHSKLRVNENNPDEWGEFLHLPGQKFHDFGKIRDEIVRDTEKMTGKNAGEWRRGRCAGDRS